MKNNGHKEPILAECNRNPFPSLLFSTIALHSHFGEEKEGRGSLGKYLDCKVEAWERRRREGGVPEACIRRQPEGRRQVEKEKEQHKWGKGGREGGM